MKTRKMKESMATQFAKKQQLDQYPSLQGNSSFKRGHDTNLHNVEKLPLS